MDTTEQLITGYTAYLNAEEIGALGESEAPATASPTVTISTTVCATAVSVSAVSFTISATVLGGC